MSKSKVLFGLGLAMGIASQAHAITIHFQSVQGAAVVFNGAGSFTFVSPQGSGGSQFQILAVDDGLGNCVGNFGFMTGPFSIGAVSTDGAVQTAPVEGTGSLVLIDGQGKSLQGTLSWDTISTSGPDGYLNVFGTLNVTSIEYTGTDTDFSKLPPMATERVQFMLPQGTTGAAPLALQDLKTSSLELAFSGTISSAVRVPDTASTLLLLGMGGGALLLSVRRKS